MHDALALKLLNLAADLTNERHTLDEMLDTVQDLLFQAMIEETPEDSVTVGITQATGRTVRPIDPTDKVECMLALRSNQIHEALRHIDSLRNNLSTLDDHIKREMFAS